MDLLTTFQTWYEQEKWASSKILEMLESVPDENRTAERFIRAVNLAHHLSACRDNWLERINGSAGPDLDWWPTGSLDELKARLARTEADWTEFLASSNLASLESDFEYTYRDARVRWNIQGQVMQLVGHAFYHRGQIALIVEELGGKTEDTDYLFWAFKTFRGQWGKVPPADH